MSEMKLSGYAVGFDPYPVHGGPAEGGWMESVDRAALEDAVAKTPRVPLKIGDKVIGEADLSVDDSGLKFDATLSVGYCFRVKDQQWDNDDSKLEYAARQITGMAFESFSINTDHE